MTIVSWILPEKSSSRQSAFQWVLFVPLFSPTSFCIHTKRNTNNLCSQREKQSSSRFNLTLRYIHDVLSINNPEFENYQGQMYPAELEIKDTTESTTSASFLYLLLSIGRDGRMRHVLDTAWIIQIINKKAASVSPCCIL